MNCKQSISAGERLGERTDVGGWDTRTLTANMSEIKTLPNGDSMRNSSKSNYAAHDAGADVWGMSHGVVVGLTIIALT